MRRSTPFGRRRFAFAAACAGVTLLAPSAGAAPKKKTVPVPPLPNVLLLVDTSGSMEKMIDGTDPEANSPLYTPSGACTLVPGTVSGGTASTPNRWGTFVQAMTGT